MYNILFLPTRYFPSISGGEFYIQRLAEILNKKYNCEVNIYTSNAIDFKALRSSEGKIINANDEYFGNVNSIKVHRFKVNYDISEHEKIKIIKSKLNSLNIEFSDDFYKKIIRNGPFIPDLIYLNKIQIKKIDIIHTTFYPYLNLIYAVIISKMYNVPVICTPFFHFSNPRYKDVDLLEVLEKFDIIISCTSKEKEFLHRRLKIQTNKIRIIPMGVDYDILHKFFISTEYRFKQKFFKKDENDFKMVLFCGYKNYEKGAISILKSIPLINKKFKKIYYVFIGPSTQAFNRELSKLRKSLDIRILNFTPENLTGYYDKIKLSAFKETDIYVMPSRSDAFGIAFLEAWVMEKPVIGARIGATPEVIREEIDGLLVDFDESEEIAQKIIFLLNNGNIRKKLGQNGRIKIEKNYTWDIITKKTLELYNQIIKHK